MKTREEYHVLINEAIQRLETGELTSVMLLNVSNPAGGYLEVAVTREKHRMDNWHGIFHSGKPDTRYCDSTMAEVAASFESLRFDTQNLMALEEFTALLGDNFRVKKFVDKDHQFIGMSDDRLVLFHISDDWSHVRETVGQHVSLAIN